jgi:hypothetical protein
MDTVMVMEMAEEEGWDSGAVVVVDMDRDAVLDIADTADIRRLPLSVPHTR